MKTRTLTWIGALLIGLTLGLVLAVAARADDTNKPPAAPEPKKHIAISWLDDRDEKLSPEVLEKLSPEQIFDLEMAKRGREENPALPVVITAIVFACPVAIVAVILVYRHRRNAMLHKTLAAMIEKGVPIPPELLQPQPQRPPSDLRRGLLLIGIGIGLIIFFIGQRDNDWGLGFIPLLMGAGYLIAWKLEQRKQNG